MIKLYALKYKGELAQYDGQPLMGEYTPEVRKKLIELKGHLSAQNPEYEKCRLIVIKEIRRHL